MQPQITAMTYPLGMLISAMSIWNKGRNAHMTKTCVNPQDSEFLGVYGKGYLWYAQVASIGGSSHHIGPFDTDVRAAIYHDALASRLHELSDELSYLEAMHTSRGLSGRFNLSKFDSCVFIYDGPPCEGSPIWSLGHDRARMLATKGKCDVSDFQGCNRPCCQGRCRHTCSAYRAHAFFCL